MLLDLPTLDGDLRHPPPSPATGALGECVAVYRRWLHLPDDGAVVAALGATAANLIPGDPLWLLLVGSPGSGKTETINPLDDLPYVHAASTFTEASLLSGTPKKQQTPGARGGLLCEVGSFGILLAKDFSGVLSMNRDARASVLSALREIYDGSWTRHIGSDGGRMLHWAGKAGFIGAVTPSIDRHHSVMGALGERFVFYRLHVDDPKAQAHRRLANRGKEKLMRAELVAAVAAVLALVDRDKPPRELSEDEVGSLVDLAAFIVQARTAVERDGYDREVVVMPSAEAPGRLVGGLAALLGGCEAVGAERCAAWRVVMKAGWDCVPDLRRRLLHHLHDHVDQRSSAIVATTGIPKTTAERALDDLVLLGLVERRKDGAHDSAAWRFALSEHARREWPGASPEVFKV